MKIAVDFDGTIVEHKYPAIGKERPFAIGIKLILWTAREGELLEEAVEYCRKRGLEFYAVNSSTPEEDLFHNRDRTSKVLADVYIDDRNLGGIPDWGEIYEMVMGMRKPVRRKRPWWKKLFRR